MGASRLAFVRGRGSNYAAIGGMFGDRHSIIIGLVVRNVYPKICDKLKRQCCKMVKQRDKQCKCLGRNKVREYALWLKFFLKRIKKCFHTVLGKPKITSL